MNEFEKIIEKNTGADLRTDCMDIIQVNVGLRCNQCCVHCHVEASPEREEMMGWGVMEKIIGLARSLKPRLVDITGGAPEMNPHFRRFVKALKDEGHSVQARTNLSIMLEKGMEDLPRFYRDNGAGLVASMPCYMEENVSAQRGAGVYKKSIEAIKRLNKEGYGVEPSLQLNLVYNPGGPFLPPRQESLEEDYRRELGNKFGIEFTHLLVITNMPIGRFRRQLKREDKENEYLELLRRSFNPQTVEGLMCRHQVNVGWDGGLYDCDFNMALGMPVNHGAPNHIERLKEADIRELVRRKIVTGEHCFGCTAGFGSSCAGALAE